MPHNRTMQPLTLRFFLGLGSLLLVHSVLGCTPSMPSPTASSSVLVGQWRQTYLGAGRELKPCPAVITIPGGNPISCGANDTVEFKDDGTFLASLSGLAANVTGKWRLEGTTLRVTFTGPPEAAGTTSSATVQFAQGSDQITVNTATGATPTAAVYVRK